MHRKITSFKEQILQKASFGAYNFKRLTSMTSVSRQHKRLTQASQHNLLVELILIVRVIKPLIKYVLSDKSTNALN